MKRTGSSEMDTALHFGLTDSSTIARWKKAFLEGKVEGLNKHKGRPPMSKKKNTEQKTVYEQELERENELLRLEVEYLKKLRAFRMDPESYLKSTSSAIIRTQRSVQIKRCITHSWDSRIYLSLSN